MVDVQGIFLVPLGDYIHGSLFSDVHLVITHASTHTNHQAQQTFAMYHGERHGTMHTACEVVTAITNSHSQVHFSGQAHSALWLW